MVRNGWSSFLIATVLPVTWMGAQLFFLHEQVLPTVSVARLKEKFRKMTMNAMYREVKPTRLHQTRHGRCILHPDIAQVRWRVCGCIQWCTIEFDCCLQQPWVLLLIKREKMWGVKGESNRAEKYIFVLTTGEREMKINTDRGESYIGLDFRRVKVPV